MSIGADCCFGGTLLKDVEYLSFAIKSKQLLLWQRLVSTGPSTDEMHVSLLVSYSGMCIYLQECVIWGHGSFSTGVPLNGVF